MSRDSIFALTTPYAKSGVAIIRLSGPHALSTLCTLSKRDDWTANYAQLTRFWHKDSMIDQGLALYFQAPASFTGEDVVELHLHGSLAVIREMLAVLSHMPGLRPAEAGEFSRRAFLNGKMDLMEAEGLSDLIEAETPAQKELAIRQMGGALSGFYHELRNRIITILAHLEAYIDFPDEEIPASVLTRVEEEVATLQNLIKVTLDDHHSGEKLRSGIRIVIVGAPNAGKSSLLNVLSRREAAIVSHQPGTTRDAIEVHLTLGGFPVILTDTAGLRHSEDMIEEEGVRRALSHAQDADLKLALFDSATVPDEATLKLLDKQTLVIHTKSDLSSAKSYAALAAYSPIAVSAKTGEGISTLERALQEQIATSFSSERAPVITRSRHRALLLQALQTLERFSPDKPLELSCEELRRAGHCVGKITGKIQVDDILDVVFRQFCIGK